MTERSQMLANALLPGIFGLAGVVVGAVITTGGDRWLAERAEAVVVEKDRLARANELKTAARLIGYEFVIAQAAATWLVERKRWAPEGDLFRTLSLEAWQRDKEIIARELPLEGWLAVRLAALTVEQFRSVAPVPRSSDDASDFAAEAGKPVLRDITVGLEALQPYMIDGTLE